METPAHFALSEWQNFYVIVGSSAGALTGLQFVVITLIAQSRAAGTMREIHAFGTPTVVHFCCALLISALMVAPWRDLGHVALCLGVFGLTGILYLLRVIWHARASTYKPDIGDKIWYIVVPVIAHVALIACAALLWSGAAWMLDGVAMVSLVFLLIGVHNAWDTVTYIVIQRARDAVPPA